MVCVPTIEKKKVNISEETTRNFFCGGSTGGQFIMERLNVIGILGGI